MNQRLNGVFMERHYMLEIAQGAIPGQSSVNKFGRSTNVDSGVDTDIWDRANTTDDDDIWTAPTQAHTHQIKSTSGSDDGDPAGVGAQTLRIFGLTSWDTKEVSEDIVLNGVANVPTVNQYVIIHRMRVLTKGATSVNVGVITATADTDATVTAQINAGEGQTQMAVYGIPRGVTAYLTGYYFSVIKAAAAVRVSTALLVNPTPDVELLNFLVKHTLALDTTGTSYFDHQFRPYFKINGPAIIKCQGNATANDTDVSSGFDLILVG
jgi:hypothetical protein